MVVITILVVHVQVVCQSENKAFNFILNPYLESSPLVLNFPSTIIKKLPCDDVYGSVKWPL